MTKKSKILRITTVPVSLKKLLKGQLAYMNGYFEVIGVSSGGKEVVDVENDEGVEVRVVEMARNVSPIKDLISLLKMIRLIRKEKPDIVHTHTPKAGLIGIIAAWICRVKIRLHTVAGLPLMEKKGLFRKILILVEKITYHFATKVYPNSFGLKEFILNERIAGENKLKVIGAGSSNGIDTDFYSLNNVGDDAIDAIRTELKLNKGYFVFGFIGRLVGDKGVNELVKSFVKTLEDEPDSRLILLGSYEKELDPLNPEVFEIIHSCDKIITPGYQNDIRPYLAVFDVLVHPSYREGFPNVVLQAASMEKALIVSDINGCNEIVSNNENGLIIPPKSVDELYKAMIKLVKNKELLFKLKDGNRANIVARFNQVVLWEQIKNEYNNYLNKYGL